MYSDAMLFRSTDKIGLPVAELVKWLIETAHMFILCLCLGILFAPI